MEPYNQHNRTRRQSLIIGSIYNIEKKTCFGRSRWQCVVFSVLYFIYLLVLAALLHGCLWVMDNAIFTSQKPYYSMQSVQPYQSPTGITVRPVDLVNGVVRFNPSDSSSYLHFIRVIERALKGHDKRKTGTCGIVPHYAGHHIMNIPRSRADRDKIKKTNPSGRIQKKKRSNMPLPCPFDLSNLGPCSVRPYGYDTSTPCFYFKMNKVFEWYPHPFNKYSVLPLHIPKDILRNITITEPPRVWFSCHHYPYKSYHNIKLEYYPYPGFDMKYFPYYDPPNYQSPIVAVRFSSLLRNTKMEFNCTAWSDEDIQYTLTMSIFLDE